MTDAALSPSAPSLTRTPWGTAPDGSAITLYTLRHGPVTARIMDYGGVIVGVDAPDRDGTLADVALGHDEAGPYFDRATASYFGALIGRYGNRIARGRFELDGRAHQLATNNGPNALHGGPGGFDQVMWTSDADVTADGPRVTLTRTSPDGEEGYPGALDVTVTYTLTADGALRLAYHAVTDAPTVVNLTNHSYWNLAGATRDVLDHELVVHADAITPVDETLIPTGTLLDVAGTPFDFRAARRVGERVDDADAQLQFAGGYDHNFVLQGAAGALRHVATLSDPQSGRVMEVHTTEPGVQFYSGNFLDGSVTGKGGQVYGHRWAVCLETQHFPDSPNRPDFPSTRLNPGEVYRTVTEYRFRTQS
ncbi:aldose epimerase family protein [Deinococcus maricopensis]|uniref:Aldose 1-epimerase n=1 Tax=Deinococcus maricopensis (strain DSM 21211 / LMG 22137 / NRRL B-23946 / LB-34) TaxID=709986 RepID=E8UAU3_DEIML|nr:aldose epimerase family protein [Deinococcus maricopensis]ADV68182.1 Aldose 1-epimerase [Deinococcus maricopensis DSM 21211]